MVVEFDYVGVVELVHDLDLHFYVFYQVLVLESFLFDLLNGVDGPSFLVPGLPYYSK